MDFHPLYPSPLPRVDEAPHERFNVLAAECMAIKGNLDRRNFQLQPLHVHAIVKRKADDVKENLKPFVNRCLSIASRMRDDTSFLAHGFLMQPKLGTCVRKILQTELQIPRGQKWPVQDVSIDIKVTMFRPSKIPASLLPDAQPKISPLLQPSQSTGAFPSSGSVHQQPNGTWQDGRLQYMEELGAKYKGEVMMSSEAPKPDAPPSSGPPRLFPLGEGRRRNEPYPQPYSPRPNRKGASSSGGPGGEGASGAGAGAGTGGVGAPGSGIPGSGDPESGEDRRRRKCRFCPFL